MNLELKLPPPYDESNYPFLLDNKILEQIGFAVGCFENYLLLDDELDMDRKQRNFQINRFVLACVLWCQNKNSAYDDIGNGYGFVTDMLKSCCGRQNDIKLPEDM